MPGIVGFSKSYVLNDFTHDCFISVSGEAFYSYVGDCELYLKSIKNDIGVDTYESDSLVVVLFGDIYSINCFDEPVTKPSVLFCQQYKMGELSNFLATVNGYFTGVILDKVTQKLLIFSDRYGLKPLYLWQESNKFIGIASELKSLLLHDKYQIFLDKNNAQMFVDVGHFLGQKTLFKGITRLAPATIVEVNLDDNTTKETLYWSWNDIKPNTTDTEQVAVDKAFKLFEQAMQRQMSHLKQNRLAITLSGGLDSRVLLAGAKKYFDGEIASFTFGSADCDDALLAKQVADLAEVDNQLVEVNENNWFKGREKGVWYTDGMKNILHMHALSSVQNISAHSYYLLNGFLGDVTFGGSYLFDLQLNNTTLNEKAKVKYGAHAQSTLPQSSYFANALPDSLFIYNRGVRFIGAGSDLLGYQLQNIKPFFDNDLIEYLYSLPESYRRNGKLYHRMLLTHYPEFFRTIPWQQTGKPISMDGEPEVVKRDTLKRRLFDVIKGSPFDSLLRKVYRKIKKNSNYVSYDAWLRTPDFKHYVLTTLGDEQSAVSQLFSRKKVNYIIAEFYKGNSDFRPEVIGSLLTIELYCQQLTEHGKQVNIT